MNAKPYPKYKDSGIEWLGNVPEHWEVKRLNLLATVKARLGWKGLTADEYVSSGYIFLATPNIKGQGEIDFVNVNYISSERYFESPEIMLKVGDVLLAKDGSTLGTANVVKTLPAEATVNSSIAVIRPTSMVYSIFLFRWLTSSVVQAVVHSMKDGQGVPHLFQADIRKFIVPVPPLSEQQAIANFLDRETQKLDTLVEKKRALIDKLKEKRMALISRTVTRGLPPDVAQKAGFNPNPKLKPSGIEWLGNVPEHWEVMAVKRCAITISKGTTPTTEGREIIDDGPIRFIKAENIADGRLTNTPLCFIDATTNTVLKRSQLEAEDLLFVIAGATLGKVAIVKPENLPANINQAIAFIRPNQRVVVEYLSWWLKSSVIREQTWLYAVQSAQPNLSMSSLGEFRVLWSPLSEQLAIADFLDRETKHIDELIAKIEAAIEKLQEYRTALITAAVTGKIDVRTDSTQQRTRKDSDHVNTDQ